MSPHSSTPAPTQPDRLDADLRRLKELDESLSERDKRIVVSLRRIARRIDALLQHKTG